MYQLWLGDDSYASLLDRVAASACDLTPGLTLEAFRDLVDLALRARVRKTEACGKHPACVPARPVWSARAVPAGETTGWQDLDPHGLPEMLATAAADLAALPAVGRHAVEERLVRAFRVVFGELLFVNPRCGHDDVCHGEPVFPAPTLRRGRR